MRSTKRLSSAAPVAMRMALAAGFLSAVADRFGLWGPIGTPGVSWGGFARFLDYTATLLPYLSTTLVAVAGCAATVAELVLGVTPRRRARSPGRARQRSPASHLRRRHDDRARPRGAAVVLGLDGGGRSLLAGPGPAGRVVGSSLTRKTLYRGGILGDFLGSRVHLPLSV